MGMPSYTMLHQFIHKQGFSYGEGNKTLVSIISYCTSSCEACLLSDICSVVSKSKERQTLCLTRGEQHIRHGQNYLKPREQELRYQLQW